MCPKCTDVGSYKIETETTQCVKSNNHNGIQILLNFRLVPFLSVLAEILRAFFFSFSACLWALRTSRGTGGTFPAGDPNNGAVTRSDCNRSRYSSSTHDSIIREFWCTCRFFGAISICNSWYRSFYFSFRASERWSAT